MSTHQPSVEAELAAASASSLADAIHSNLPDELKGTASDPALTEDLALAFLKRNDLSAETFEQLSKNSAVCKSRKVRLAVVCHPKAPRYVSMMLLRQLFTFDLMRVGFTPAVPGDVKLAAEEVLIKRMEAISSGEKISLARRATGRIAGVLLSDAEPRVMRTALENGRLTDTLVIRALTRPKSSAELVHAVCHHPKWSLRREVRIALLRNEHTPPSRALEFSRSLPLPLLKEILQNSRLPRDLKSNVLQQRIAVDNPSN
ncbi:MAG TPA: hypothetical protein VMB18_01405 [Terriglobales bacterium]|nr:hypothetical protein [Terriglobales bacterium]